MKLNELLRTEKTVRYYISDLPLLEDELPVNMEKISNEIYEYNFGDSEKGLPEATEETANFVIEKIKTITDKKERIKNTPSKEINVPVTKALSINQADWLTMQEFMPNPEQFQKEEFRVYKDYLASNLPDRDSERFPLIELGKLSRTIVSKSKMHRHDKDYYGYGVYFKSEIEVISEEQELGWLQDYPDMDRLRSHIKYVKQMEGGIYWMVPHFYMFADNPLVRDHDAGIVKRSSIGFAAKAIVEIVDDEGYPMFWEWRGIEEAREGSSVWLESQYGSAIRKAAADRPKVNDMKKDCEKININLLIKETKGVKENPQKPNKTEKSDETKNVNTNGGYSMYKLICKAFGKEVQVPDTDPEKAVTEFLESVDAEAQKLTEERDALKAKSDMVETIFGTEVTEEILKTIKETAETLQKRLVDDVVSLMVQNKVLEQEKAEEKTKELAEMDLKPLMEIHGLQVKAFDISDSSTIKTTENDEQKNETSEKNTLPDPDTGKPINMSNFQA